MTSGMPWINPPVMLSRICIDFLGDKLKNGAVYQVGDGTLGPDMSYLDSVSQPRSITGSSPPVKKKRVTPEVATDLQGGREIAERALQMQLQLSEVAECMEGVQEGEDPLGELIDQFTPEDPAVQGDSQEVDEDHTRPQRERKQTHLYQSEEVALLDKKGGGR